jgi:predicted aspartyl protease
MTVMADNTTRDTRTILIDRVVIGGKIITNVRAYVAPDGSDMLLGMGVLGRFGKFSIDTVNGRLTLG